MSNVIDSRIVEMKFDNSDFEKNVKTSMNTLDDLNKKLEKGVSADSLEKVNEASKGLKLDGIANAVENVSSKFSALGVIGFTALQKLTDSAINLGTKLLTAIPSQIYNGGLSRAMNIEQAKFQLEGLGIAWETVKENIDYAVSGTAYGLDSAAKACSQLSASGVQAGEDMKAALRGISGVAAMTNSEYDDISRIFTTVAGNGRLMADQLNQLSSRGINAAATLGQQLGKSEAEIRSMTSKGQISFAMFSKAMDDAFGEHAKDANKTFTGVMSNIRAALSKIGADFLTPIIKNEGPLVNFLNQIRIMINTIRAALKPLIDMMSGTVIKVLDSMASRLKEIFDRTYIDDFKKSAKDLIESGKISSSLLDKLNEKSKTVSDYIGGALFNGFKAILSILKPIKEAFAAIFPKKSVEELEAAAKKLEEFTSKLILSDKNAANLRDTFKGLFSIFKLLGNILSTVLSTIFPMISPASSLLEIVLQFTGTLGRVITYLVSLVDVGQLVSSVFEGIATVFGVIFAAIATGVDYISNAIKQLKELEAVQKTVSALEKTLQAALIVLASFGALLVAAILKLVEYGKLIANSKFIQDFIQKLSSAAKTLKENIISLGDRFENFFNVLKNAGSIGERFQILVNKIKELKNHISDLSSGNGMSSAFVNLTGVSEKLKSVLEKLGNALEVFVSYLTPGKVAALAFSAAVVGMFIAVQKIAKGISGLTGSLSSFVDGLSDMLHPVVKSSFENTLLKLAASLVAVAGAMYLINKINPDRTWSIIGQMSVMLGELLLAVTALAALDKFLAGGKLDKVSSALILVAGSVLVLTTAMLVLEQVDLNGVWTRVGVLGAICAEIAAVGLVLSFMKGSIKGAVTLLAFSLSINKAISALALLSNVDLDNIHEHLLDLVVIIAALGVLSLAASKVGVGSLLGVLSIALVLKVLMSTLQNVGEIKLDLSPLKKQFEQSSDAIIAIGVFVTGLIAIVGLLGDGVFKFSLGMVALSGAIMILIQCSKQAGKLTDEEFIKGGIAVLAALSMIAILAAVSGFTKENEMIKLAASLYLISGVVAILIKVAETAGNIPTKKLRKGEIAVGVLLALIGALILCSKATENVKASTIIGLVAGLVILFGELVVLTLIPLEDIIPAAVAMCGILAVLSVLFKQIGEMKLKAANVVALITVAGIILELGFVLAKLAKFDWPNLLFATIAVGATLMAVGKAVKSITDVDGRTFGKNKMKGMLTVAASLIAVGAALALVAKCDWHNILGATFAINVTLGAFAGVCYVLSKMKGIKEDSAKSILLVALSLLPIAVAIRALADFDWASGWQGLTAMAVALGALVGVTAILSKVKVDLNTVAAFLAGAIAMMGIAYALAQLAAFDWENVIISAAAMSLAITAVAGALALLSAIGDSLSQLAGAGAIVIVAVGLVVLADALTRFGAVDVVALEEAVVALFAITAAVTALGLIGPYVLIGAAAILIVCGALDLLALSIKIAAEGLMLMGPALAMFQTISSGLGSTFTELAGGLTLFALACSVLALATPGLLVGATLLPGMAAGLTAMANIGDLSGIAGPLAAIGAACIVLGVAAPGMTIAAVGMQALAKGITALAAAATVASVSIDRAMKTIVSSIKTTMNQLKPNLVKAGQDGLRGLIQGSNDAGLIANLKKIWTNIADKGGILQAFRNATGWHSPWTKLVDAAKDGLRGLINGSGDSGLLSTLKSTWTNVCQNGMLNPVQGCITQLKGIFSNLSGVFSSFSNIGSTVTNAVNSIGSSSSSTSYILEQLGIDTSGTSSIMDTFTDVLDETTSSLGKTGGAATETKDAFQELTDKIAGQIDLFSEFSAKTDLSSDQLLSNMKSQIDGVSNWANMMAQLGEKGIDEGLLEYLGNLGPQGYEYVNAFVNMTAEQLETANGYFQKSLTLPGEAASTIQASYANAGAMATLGFENGLNLTTVAAKCKEMGVTGLEALEQSLKINSPSKATEEDGEYFMAGFDRGLRGGYLIHTLPTLIEIAHGMIEMFQTFLSPEAAQPIGDTFVTAISTAINTGLQTGMATDTSWVTKIIPPEAAVTLQTQATTLGTGINNGIITGIQTTYTLVVQKAQDLIKSILQVMQMQLVHNNGQSQKTKEFGLGVCNGFTQGMTNGTYAVLTKARTICQQVIQVFSSNITRSKFEQYGRYVSEGFAAGMESALGRIETAARKMVEAAEKATKAAAEIKSPSRLFKRIGKYIPEGLAIGIEKNLSPVTEASESMVDAASSALSEAITMLSDSIDADMDLNPTITPVLDMTNIQNGVNDINSMFNRSVAISAANASRANVSSASSFSSTSDDSANSSNGNQFIFNQNNYSPKALNQVEIYRQTRNQFSQMKGLVYNS